MTCETRIKSEYIAEIKNSAKNQAKKRNIEVSTVISSGNLVITFFGRESESYGAAMAIKYSLKKAYNVEIGLPTNNQDRSKSLYIGIKKDNIQQVVNIVNTNKVNTFSIPEKTKQVEQPTIETKPNRIQEEIKNKPGVQLSLFKQPLATQPIKPGVEELFESNPELASIGTPQLYSQYLDTIFPDSKVKDIVYHGTIFDFPKFSKKKLGRYTQAPSASQGFFFTNNKLVSDSYIKPERIEEQEWIYNQNKKFVEKYGKLTDISKVDNAIKELKELLEFQNNNTYNLRPNTPEYYSDSEYVIFKDSKDAKFNSYREEEGWEELEPQQTYRRFYDYRSNSYNFEEVSGKKLEILVNKLYKKPTKKDYKFNKNYLESSLSWMEYIKDLYEQGEDLPNLPIKFQWEIAENQSYGNKELLNTYIINKYAEIGKTSYRKPTPITKNVILNLENPLIFDYEGEKYRSVSYYDKLKEANNKGNDGAILQNTYDSGFLKEDKYQADVFVVFEPEQIHILGSKQDIEGFKSFVEKTPTQTTDNFNQEDTQIINNLINKGEIKTKCD